MASPVVVGLGVASSGPLEPSDPVGSVASEVPLDSSSGEAVGWSVSSGVGSFVDSGIVVSVPVVAEIVASSELSGVDEGSLVEPGVV